MSLIRLIYYNAVIGGWAAFLGWLAAQVAFGSGGRTGPIAVGLISAVVGGAIGGGLGLVGGAANARWKRQLKRFASGLGLGALGGALGGGMGNLLSSGMGLPRWLGWVMMGAGIGVADGLFEKSRDKVRKGLIGGSVGGLMAGLLFDPIAASIRSDVGLFSRAVGFAILGMCIGTLIGVVQVVLKEAWLTVLDGYRPGRQLILSQQSTLVGRAEWAALPFMAPGDRVLEPEHLRIERLPDGNYALAPRGATSVNGQTVAGRRVLRDGDVIQFGNNSVRFNERHKKPDPLILATPAPPVAETARTIFEEPSRPAPAPPPPAASPPPRAAPKPAVGALTPPASAGNLCPSCGKDVGKGQRYCIRCDLDF